MFNTLKFRNFLEVFLICVLITVKIYINLPGQDIELLLKFDVNEIIPAMAITNKLL